MADVFSDVLAQLEDQNAVLNQQLGVAKYWCQSLRSAVVQLAQEGPPQQRCGPVGASMRTQLPPRSTHT